MNTISRWNLGLTAVLTGMAALRLQLWPFARPATAHPYPDCNRPIYSDYIVKLAAVYLNAGINPPAAFQSSSGTLDGNTAYFQIYALSNDSRFYANVTSEYGRRCNGVRILSVRIKPAPGSHDVSGTVAYANASFQNQVSYQPKHAYRKERTALITFVYRLTVPRGVYRATYSLKIPGQPLAGDPAPRN